MNSNVFSVSMRTRERKKDNGKISNNRFRSLSFSVSKENRSHRKRKKERKKKEQRGIEREILFDESLSSRSCSARGYSTSFLRYYFITIESRGVTLNFSHSIQMISERINEFFHPSISLSLSDRSYIILIHLQTR